MDKGKISTMQKLQKQTISKPSSFAVDLPFKQSENIKITYVCTERGTGLTRRAHRKKKKRLHYTTRSLDNSMK